MSTRASYLLQVLKLFLAWVLLFFLQRVLFLFAYGQYDELGAAEIWEAHQTALPLDISAIGYVMLLPVILLIINLWSKKRWAVSWAKVLLVLSVVISSIITITDIGLFGSWGTRINQKSLDYLAYPSKALASAESVPWEYVLLTLLLGVAAGFLFLRIRLNTILPKPYILSKVLISLGLLLGLVLSLRGGFSDLPIERSWSYHSTKPVLNQAATNGVWNFLEVVFARQDDQLAAYSEEDLARSTRMINAVHTHSSRPETFLSDVERPNILIVLLEGIPSTVVGCMGGEKGVSKCMDSIATRGIRYTDFYSTGFRTEQGLCALLSGFPAQASSTVMRDFGKFEHLPSLVHELQGIGYNSTYWYGGDVEFANTRAYLQTMGVANIWDETTMPIVRRTRWGALDEELFAFYLDHLEQSAQPFFDIIMTSTSHEPYDKAPVAHHYTPNSELPNAFRNTVHYTDSCVGALISELEQWPGYENTLVMIMSDHAHQLPGWLDNRERARHHIPFILTGGALKEELRGTSNSTVASHLDIPRTLLNQLKLDASEFTWSKDMYSSQEEHFAYYTFDKGFGLIDSSGSIVFDYTIMDTLNNSFPPDLYQQKTDLGKAYFIELARQYVDLDS